ncbi:hypothetical protein ACFQJ7_14015 [Halovenus rubra]|uniref:DUF7260 domain-containing protein n=2 Tax=Halovenus rubra TaxID=869890 RepID=A0ABD5XB46_9EURY|nr:hypothetical protein [Halovenus rubra]
MSIKENINQARVRVEDEQEIVDGKIDGFDSFIDRVTELSVESPSSTAPGITATGGGHFGADSSADDRCRAVRTAFAETVHPHSLNDIDGSESLLETIRSEFTNSVAVALAPTTETSFSTELKEILLSEANARRAEVSIFSQVLTDETTRIDAACEAVDEMTQWIVTVDQTPLTDEGFDELRERHERLCRYRDRCDELVQQRQAFIQTSTSESADIGIQHEQLVSYLYQDLPVEYPILSTLTRLYTVCAECQDVVRQHLLRRA